MMQEHSGFGSLVRDISKLARRRFDRKASEVGLTQAQCIVINHLAEHEGINQASLAEMMNIEPITLVGLIDRLERAGLVERRNASNDRRVRLLYLTKQARPLLEKMNAIQNQLGKEAFAGFSIQDQRHTIDLLEKIRSNLAANKQIFMKKNKR